MFNRTASGSLFFRFAAGTFLDCLEGDRSLQEIGGKCDAGANTCDAIGVENDRRGFTDSTLSPAVETRSIVIY